MKLSVSLSDDDVRLLDEVARAQGLSTRSAALHLAVQSLRRGSLEQEYMREFEDWDGSDDSALWDSAAGDGIDRAAR